VLTAAQVQRGNGAPIAQLQNADGTPFSGDLNSNFGKPTEYQPPHMFRFGLRTSF